MADVDPSGGLKQADFVPFRLEGCPILTPRSLDELQEMFVRAHALERREPGGRKWPFAGDGPWHLIQPEVGDIAGDWSETLIETDSGKQLQVRKVESREPRPALDAAEVAELAQLRSWLLLVPERDRKLVWVATARLSAGEGRVPWKAIGRWLNLRRESGKLAGRPLDPDTIALRYRQAVARAVCRLNRWPERRAQAMAR